MEGARCQLYRVVVVGLRQGSEDGEHGVGGCVVGQESGYSRPAFGSHV